MQRPNRYKLFGLFNKKAVLAVALLSLFSGICLAASGTTIADISENLVTQLNAVAKLMVYVSYVAGIGFALVGIMKFKAHKDAPQQTPLSLPIILIAVAAGLLFLPTAMKTAGGTLFEGGGQSGESFTGLQ